MNEQPEYKSKGILAKAGYEIDPQELFQDAIIFAPWNAGVTGKVHGARRDVKACARP